MDLYSVISQLRSEASQIEHAIHMVEQLQNPQPAKRRGRKSMAPAERLIVSARMRKYWAARRKEKAATA